jgi:hypothetical protein
MVVVPGARKYSGSTQHVCAHRVDGSIAYMTVEAEEFNLDSGVETSCGMRGRMRSISMKSWGRLLWRE